MKPWENQFYDHASALQFLQNFLHDSSNMAVLRQLYEEDLSLGGGFMLDDQELLDVLAHQMVAGVFKIVPLPTVPHSPTAEGFTKVVTIEEEKKERTKIISDELTWIAFRLKYDDGEPIPYEPYEIYKPDGGLLQKGKLNEEGYVRVDQILPGDYSIVFPGRGGAPADTGNTDWIEVKLVDEDGEPMPREVYEIIDSEGKVYRRGQLDAEGFVREEGVEKGAVYDRVSSGGGRSGRWGRTTGSRSSWWTRRARRWRDSGSS